MKDYITIHTFLNGEIGIEKVKAKDIDDVYNQAERNDSAILILSVDELNIIHQKVGQIDNNKIYIIHTEESQDKKTF